MQNRIKALWKEAFGDEDEIIDAYIETFHECEMLLTREQGDKLLSMLHLVPFTAQGCRIAYIYAVATATEERGKGHATALINEAISRSKEAGMDAVALIPANEELKDYYGRFGFKSAGKAIFEAEGFDFGTGDNKKDLLSILPLNEKGESAALPGNNTLVLKYDKKSFWNK